MTDPKPFMNGVPVGELTESDYQDMVEDGAFDDVLEGDDDDACEDEDDGDGDLSAEAAFDRVWVDDVIPSQQGDAP